MTKGVPVIVGAVERTTAVDGFRLAYVVVPDLRGFGASDKHLADPTLQYSADAQARGIIALIDELGLDRPVLAGYDIGSAGTFFRWSVHRSSPPRWPRRQGDGRTIRTGPVARVVDGGDDDPAVVVRRQPGQDLLGGGRYAADRANP